MDLNGKLDLDNKLSLHIGKTECILFGTGRKLKRADDFQVVCDGTLVKRVSSVKYLGVQLDEYFKFSVHVSELIKKCAGRIAFLYRNLSHLDLDCRRILCNSLIQPHLDYCCSSWYSPLTQQLKNRLDVIKRRTVKLVHSKSHYYYVTTGGLKSLSWLSVPDRIMLCFYSLSFYESFFFMDPIGKKLLRLNWAILRSNKL